MEKAVELFRNSLFGLDSNINPNLIKTIKVRYLDQTSPIEHLALVDSKEKVLVITVFDQNSSSSILATIKSNGFDCYLAAKNKIIINKPIPSGETKNKIINQIKKHAEEARISIRNIRKNIKNHISGTEDEIKRQEKLLQEKTDFFIKDINLIEKDFIDRL